MPKTTHKTQFFCIDRKIYKGIGRPKNIDYLYFNSSDDLLCFIFGASMISKNQISEVIKEIDNNI